MNNSKGSSENSASRIAPAETLLGLLQRGRGAGFLRALDDSPPEVRPLLLECIVNDARWDTQVEERADYYGRLTLLTGLEPNSIESSLRTGRGPGAMRDMSLAIDTLGRMAQLGSASALRVLREYVAYGSEWDFALEQLAQLPDPAAIEGLADIVCARFSTGKEMEEKSGYGLFLETALHPLWEQWRPVHPCIVRLLNEVQEVAGSYKWEEAPDYNTFPVHELLTAINKRNRQEIEKIPLSRLRDTDVKTYVAAFSTDNPSAWSAAVRCLRAMKLAAPYYDLALDRAMHYVEATTAFNKQGREHGAIADLLAQLPAEITLPVARRWYNAPQWQLRYVGERILEQHATLEDIPQVRAALSTAIASATPFNTDMYRVCAALDILSRFPGIGPMPEVEEAFTQTAYSPARRRAGRAMQANAYEWFSETYALECMCDCDEETREIGCESVSLLMPRALERLNDLAKDEFEAEIVRGAAAARIAPV